MSTPNMVTLFGRKKQLSTHQDVLLGCDPEFFFSQGGKIIGSEKILPELGLHEVNGYGTIVRDGVQAEFNPRAMACRQQLKSNLSRLFELVNIQLNKYPDVKVDFSQVVRVSEAEMASLGEKSQTFGCAESKNAHLKTLDKISKIGVDPKKYMKRSAGGHIHLGFPTERVIADFDKPKIEMVHGFGNKLKVNQTKTLKFDNCRNPDILVPLLDILVGNTCVLLDRDEGNIERRKVYGRAGEYRQPAHGIEYRTLSNFWLRHPVLMSLVMSLARTAVQIVVEDTEETKWVDKLMSLVDMNEIEAAINNNDYDLAYANFKKIEKFLMSITPSDGWYAINPSNIKIFHFFVEKGLNHWFKKDPMMVWLNPYEQNGFNDFLTTTVIPAMI